MQTFGEPRDTTNPYLVMLRDALVGGADHRARPLLLASGPDRAVRRAARALARHPARCASLVDEGRQARGPRRPRPAPRARPDRRGAHRAQRHAAVGPVPRPGAHPGDGAADRRSDPHLRHDPRGGRGALGAHPARALSRLVRRDAASRRSARATRVRRPDQALQGRRAAGRRLRRGIRHRSDTHPPDRRKPTDEAVERRLRAASERLGGLETTLGVPRRGGVRRGGHLERARRAAVPVHAQLGDRVGGALARPPRARARQRPQSRTVVGGRGRAGCTCSPGSSRPAPCSTRCTRFGPHRPRRRPTSAPASGTTPAPATPAPTAWPWAIAATARRHRRRRWHHGEADDARARRRHPDLPAPGCPRDRALGRPGAGRRRERHTGSADAMLDPGGRQRSGRIRRTDRSGARAFGT